MSPLTGLFLALGLGLGFSVQAADPACLPKDKVSEILKHVSIGNMMGVKTDLCDPSNPGYKVMHALISMSQLDLSGQVPSSTYNREILGKSWFSHFSSKKGFKIVYTADCPAGAGAFTDIEQSKNTLHVCPGLFSHPGVDILLPDRTDSVDVADIMSLFLHEVRHLERADGYPHQKCDNGVSFAACDPSMDYKGAYAVSVEVLSKIGISAKNVHPVLASYARFQAFSMRHTNFMDGAAILNDPSLQTNPLSLALQTTDGHAVFLHGSTVDPIYTYLPPGDFVANLDLSVGFVPWDSKRQSFLLPDAEYFQLPPDFLPKPMKDDFSEPQDVVQIHADGTQSGAEVIQRVTPSFWIRGILKDGHVLVNAWDSKADQHSKFEIQLPQGRPVSVRAQPIDCGDDQIENDPSSTFYILNDADQLYRVEISATAAPTVQEVTNPYPGFVKAYSYSCGLNSETYLLDRTGTLFVDASTGGHASKNPPQKVQSVAGKTFSRFLFFEQQGRSLPPELEFAPYSILPANVR